MITVTFKTQLIQNLLRQLFKTNTKYACAYFVTRRTVDTLSSRPRERLR